MQNLLTENLNVRLPLEFIKGTLVIASIGKPLNCNDITSGTLL